MKAVALIAGGLAAGVAVTSPAYAQPLSYWGKSLEGNGWIEFGHRQYYEIRAGTEIPAWGRVKEVHDDWLVVEQVRTGAEKDALRRKGLLVYDEVEIHIPREDLRRAQEANSPRFRR